MEHGNAGAHSSGLELIKRAGSKETLCNKIVEREFYGRHEETVKQKLANDEGMFVTRPKS